MSQQTDVWKLGSRKRTKGPSITTRCASDAAKINAGDCKPQGFSYASLFTFAKGLARDEAALTVGTRPARI